VSVSKYLSFVVVSVEEFLDHSHQKHNKNCNDLFNFIFIFYFYLKNNTKRNPISILLAVHMVNSDIHLMKQLKHKIAMGKCILLVLTILLGFCFTTKHITEISQHDASESSVLCWWSGSLGGDSCLCWWLSGFFLSEQPTLTKEVAN